MGNASKYLVGKLNYEKTFVLFCSEGLSRKKKKKKNWSNLIFTHSRVQEIRLGQLK